VRPGEPLVVMISGGADSICLLDVCVRLGARVSALHVNYKLRDGADGDEALCRELCEQLGVPLTVEHVSLPAASEGAAGNLQAEAREARYRLAEALVASTGGDYAAAHTASDQAETVLYRLVVSPGRRALLGMDGRRGRLVRPLLGATRADTRAYCEARELPWREDPSNSDVRFARARVRHEILPALAELSPAVERTIAETALLLRDEAEVLDAAVDEALARLGDGPIPTAELARMSAGLARLVLRRLAEAAAGSARALSRAEADAVLALGAGGGTRALDLGGGLRAVAEYGMLRFTAERDDEAAELDPVRLPLPGAVRFGAWEVRATLAEGGTVGEAAVRMGPRGGSAVVRAWRSGDRIRPTGLGGSKSLQDLFVDQKVPRAFRRTLPLVELEGEIVWVAGVAVAEEYAGTAGAAGPDDEPLFALDARRVDP